MARIVINNALEINGNLSFDQEANAEKTDVIIRGILSTHLYFEEITSIETYRYRLKDVDVYKESFGSDDYNIIYYFSAKALEIKGVEIAKGAYTVIDKDEMQLIESNMYKDDHYILGNIGVKIYREQKEDEK